MIRAACIVALTVAVALIVGRWARVGWESYAQETEVELQQKNTSWEAEIRGACVTHTVTTNQQVNESQEDFCARHSQAVRADITGDFPPKKE